ncbi:Os06g0349750, partial [Oryza sativa Japonica Group]
AGQPRRWHGAQPLSLGRGEPEHVVHVELERLRPSWQRPVEAVQELREAELHGEHPQLHPRARPPPGPERQVLEVPTLELHARALVGEPRRPERRRVGPPQRLVAAHGLVVDPDARPARDSVAPDGAVVEALAEEERQRRVETEHLLGDAPEVGEVVEVVLVDPAAEANHAG